jgi:hypothetical protein
VNTTLKKIANVIIDVAKREDDELRSINHNKGIFDMPELAFAYQCGKSIMLNRHDVFGEDVPKWEREVDLGNGGPTDLIFRYPNNRTIAIEFKIRDTLHAYRRDINKLLKLDPTTHTCCFCSLIDVFTKHIKTDGLIDADKDGRYQETESTAGAKLLRLTNVTPNFPTQQTKYTDDISCVIGLWEVTHP